MGSMLVEFGGRFLEWSTTVDAPTTYLMTEEELKRFVLEEEGYVKGLAELEQRLERVRKFGTSSRMGTTKEDLLSHNRAGPGETHIATEEEMVERYGSSPEQDELEPGLNLAMPLELVDRYGFRKFCAPIVKVLSQIETYALVQVKLTELAEPVVVLFDSESGEVLSKNFAGEFLVRNVGGAEA